ncbi:MAG: AraC family transcriptional regulator [Deltaproteobacteria bacterium]|nr:AraC family transcriptional regulator [Deltaproteobacteria bacterium]
MTLTTTIPALDLATQVAMLWAVPLAGARGGGLFECYPDCGASLVLRLSSSGCRLALVGPCSRKAVLPLDADAEYIGVRFLAGQVPRVADLRPADLNDELFELSRLGGMRLDDLAEQLVARPDLPSRQALIEALLRGGAPLVRDVRVRRAALLLEKHAGQLRVDALAAAMGLHARSLERLFRNHLGVSPKRLARLARFRHLVARLTTGGGASQADLAFACGYSDQAHMIREFKELAGHRPGEAVAAQPLRPVRGEPADYVPPRCRG